MQTDYEFKKELWSGGFTGLKEKYLQSLTNINRAGIADLAAYLQETDFFLAPASAKNHNNYKGGLVEHSLLVMLNIRKLSENYFVGPNMGESLSIVSLLHDICKVDLYIPTSKQTPRKDTEGNLVLDDRGKKIWDTVSGYDIVDKYPLGHGEKSVIILQRFIKLTNDEIMAIRWHMMGFDDSAREYGGSLALRAAADKYPLVTVLHMADLASCYLESDLRI